MDYEQATQDINTMYTYCAFDNYFASLGAFFGIAPPPVDEGTLEGSVELQLIHEHVGSDITFTGIQQMAKNVARIGGLLRGEYWSKVQCLIDGFNGDMTDFNPEGTTLAGGECFGSLVSQIFDTFLA